MSEPGTNMGRGGDVWDAPNQQVVRPDESGPWEEGTGGEPGSEPLSSSVEEETNDLDSMTKAELIDEAERRGIDVDPTATKAEIREAIV